MKAFFNRTILLNVIFCIGYLVLATLGFQWGALTAHATLLWPPSGLAVFGCVAFGRRVLPGLLLGSIISSQSISLLDPMGNTLLNYLISSVNGGASILQAFIIGRFFQRYYERNFQVSTFSAFCFTLIVLASCTLAATFSNFMLWQADVISLAMALQNWPVWWMGDAVGVLILTPLLLWIYPKHAICINSQANAFLIFCAGLGIVLLTVTAVGHSANIDLATRDISTQNALSPWPMPSFLQISILILGVALVILLSAYLQALNRQDQLIIDNQEKLKEEINSQTQALRAANEWLLKEIEERRSTQERLKASEAHMRTLLDNIPDPIWFKSNEGVYLSFNKAVTALFYQREQDIAGTRAADHVDADFAAEIDKFEVDVLASSEAVRKELWMYIPAKNETRLMDTIKVAMRDLNNNPIGILSIARDITEQRQLIDELEKFKQFAEYASEGLSIMSLSTEALYMNRSMQRMLLSNQKISHNNFLNYLPSDLHEQWREQILPYLLLNGYWQGELAALRTDGSRFPTKETFFIIRDDKGQPIYIGEVMSDISEQKQVEASLQLAKEAAESATLAKSRFLANMSHEIRTPLNAVLGYSQLLITDPQLTSQQHERMHAILNAGQRLLHLINDILDLSKIEAGALQFRQDYFDLRQELNEVLAIMRTKAIAKGLILNHDIKLPTPAIIKSDRQKIGQILLNLLGNAIKFTPAGEVQLNVYLDATGIIFNIVDTGPGIASHELQYLFSAFKQGQAGEESGGTGLGLVISKHIAESLGGTLTLDSNPGKGTRARLRLPVAIEGDIDIDQTLSIIQPTLAKGSHCQVLVVEDDPASRDLLVSLLRNMGCGLTEAVNGKEGLAMATKQKPDIIFTDIRMPELSGADMLRELRRIYPKESLPVIAVTASSLAHERNFYLGEGFQEFIGKPYQFRDIYAAVEKFANVELVEPEYEVSSIDDNKTDRPDWVDPNELARLRQELDALKQTLNKGDMNNSKKLFALQSISSLGKESYLKIQNAIRHYDLVMAEQFVDEVLTEVTAAQSNNGKDE